MKHLPFHSIYRENFEVVEERQGHVRLFPHTAQLPVIHRALNLEFLGPLPGKLSRLDHRASDFDRICRHMAALAYCSSFNEARKDEVLLFEVLDAHRIGRIAVVQHLRKETRLGPCHRFRFYAGPDFAPEIYLNGKHVVFADHVLERFSSRVKHHVGADLTDLLLAFYGGPLLSLPMAAGRAFFATYEDTILAFPYKESAHEFFITTCLTLDQMHTFELDLPPLALNFHYHSPFTPPQKRHWSPTMRMHDFHERWKRKAPPRERPPRPRGSWARLSQWVPTLMKKNGHGPGTRFLFLDHIPGPCSMVIHPGAPEPAIDDLEGYKKVFPGHDWDAIFAEQLAPPDHYDHIKS